jgi:hypothetical protein
MKGIELNWKLNEQDTWSIGLQTNTKEDTEKTLQAKDFYRPCDFLIKDWDLNMDFKFKHMDMDSEQQEPDSNLTYSLPDGNPSLSNSNSVSGA